LTSGCYNQYSITSADYSESGDWGWADTTLGSNEFYVDWSLNGAQNTAKPVTYYNSVATKNILFEGDLLQGGANRPGTEVGGKWSTYKVSSLPAWTNAYWDPNGYKSYDTSYACYSQLVGVTWSYANYAGYWYVSAKSIIYCKSHNTAGYEFQGVNVLPSSPTNAGYNS